MKHKNNGLSWNLHIHISNMAALVFLRNEATHLQAHDMRILRIISLQILFYAKKQNPKGIPFGFCFQEFKRPVFFISRRMYDEVAATRTSLIMSANMKGVRPAAKRPAIPMSLPSTKFTIM